MLLLVFVFRIVYNARGGRSSHHLNDSCMVEYARKFTHVFVMVADNGIRENQIYKTVDHFITFAMKIVPTKVKFAGLTSRKDFSVEFRSNMNKELSFRLKKLYKSTSLIKRKDFNSRDKAHYDSASGFGADHLGVLIKSVCEEFEKM